VSSDNQITIDILNDIQDEILVFVEKNFNVISPVMTIKILQLIIIYLGEKFTVNINFLQPGAYHLT